MLCGHRHTHGSTGDNLVHLVNYDVHRSTHGSTGDALIHLVNSVVHM